MGKLSAVPPEIILVATTYLRDAEVAADVRHRVEQGQPGYTNIWAHQRARDVTVHDYLGRTKLGIEPQDFDQKLRQAGYAAPGDFMRDLRANPTEAEKVLEANRGVQLHSPLSKMDPAHLQFIQEYRDWVRGRPAGSAHVDISDYHAQKWPQGTTAPFSMVDLHAGCKSIIRPGSAMMEIQNYMELHPNLARAEVSISQHTHLHGTRHPSPAPAHAHERVSAARSHLIPPDALGHRGKGHAVVAGINALANLLPSADEVVEGVGKLAKALDGHGAPSASPPPATRHSSTPKPN